MEKPDRTEQIRALCKDLRESIVQPDGSRVYDFAKIAPLGLNANGMQIHELSLKELRAALIGLAGTLTLPRRCCFQLPEHDATWAWAAEIALYPFNTFLSMNPKVELDSAIREIYETAVRCALVKSSGLRLDRNLERLESDSRNILGFLAFPLLEALCRKTCSAFVDPTGIVVSEFTVINGSNTPERMRAGRRCSNLGHVLRLLVSQVASPELSEDALAIIQLVSEAEGRDGFDAIYEWRCTALHGEATIPTMGYVVLTLCSLIALDYSQLDYEELQQSCAWNLQQGDRWRTLPGHYYPP